MPPRSSGSHPGRPHRRITFFQSRIRAREDQTTLTSFQGAWCSPDVSRCAESSCTPLSLTAALPKVLERPCAQSSAETLCPAAALSSLESPRFTSRTLRPHALMAAQGQRAMDWRSGSQRRSGACPPTRKNCRSRDTGGASGPRVRKSRSRFALRRPRYAPHTQLSSAEARASFVLFSRSPAARHSELAADDTSQSAGTRFRLKPSAPNPEP